MGHRVAWVWLFVAGAGAAFGCGREERIAAAGASVPESVHPAMADSILWQSSQRWLARRRSEGAARFADIDPRYDPVGLFLYAKECEAATGIRVPAFYCDLGVEVPGQGTVPQGQSCDQPNVLNRVCDPGSRFQVLPGRTKDAVAVAHCRRNGHPANGPLYNDIAVIQYNKANGAVCFYQALNNLSAVVTAPDDILGNVMGAFPWFGPAHTQGIGCTDCHDNGAFIRSGYLRQLKKLPNALPTTSDGYNNLTTPLRYVGKDFAGTRSWSVHALPDASDTEAPCDTCHRLGVSNGLAPDHLFGTAAALATFSTAATQPSKHPHSDASPIWMRPNRVEYSPAAEASARRVEDCAKSFIKSKFRDWGAGCRIEPLGIPWGPYSSYALQTGTVLQETPSNFTFLVAANRDVFAIKRAGTGSGKTEVHVLSAAKAYQEYSLQTPTALQETPSGFSFALAPNNDLFVFARVGTGTHSTEVHVLTAASDYQQYIEHTGTPLHETPADFDFFVATNRDVVAVKRAGSGTHKTEVHVLSAAKGYQEFSLQTATALAEAPSGFSFGLGSNGDLFAIQRENTGSRTTEVHILTAKSDYQDFSLQTLTVLHETPEGFDFSVASNNDLFAFRRTPGTGSTEIHILRAKP